MRPDQIARLQELSERLADVFIVEADPDNWSGAGKLPDQMEAAERGNRVWDRKGAMGTGGVLKYTLDLLAHQTTGAKGEDAMQAERDADLDAKIREAEKRASEAVNRAMKNAKGEPARKLHAPK